MCGFVGFVGGTDNQSEVLTKMMDRIVHRGPDMGGQNGGAQTGPNGQQYYDADYKVVDDDDNNKK